MKTNNKAVKSSMMSWCIVFLWVTSMAFLYGWQGGMAFLFLLSVGILVLLQGLFMNWLGPKSAKVVRHWTPRLPMAGQDIVVSFEITLSGGLLPLWLELEDYPESEMVQVQPHTELRPEGRLRWSGFRRHYSGQYVIKQAKRGVYQGGYVLLGWGDAFGWFTRKLAISMEDTCMVQPAMVGIESISYRGMGSDQSAVRVRSMLPVQAVAQERLRHYEAGDPIKNIHWKSSAKRGSLLTRHSEFNSCGEKLMWLNRDQLAYRDTGIKERTEKDQEQMRNVGHKAYEELTAEDQFEFFVSVATAWLRREIGGDNKSIYYIDNKMRQPISVNHPTELQQMLIHLSGVTLSQQQPGVTEPLSLPSFNSIGLQQITMITGQVTENVVNQLLHFITQGAKVELWCDQHENEEANESQYRLMLEQAGVLIIPIQVTDLMPLSVDTGGAQDVSSA